MTRRFQSCALIGSFVFLILMAAIGITPWQQYRQKRLDHDLIAAMLADNTHASLAALDAGANANVRGSDKPLPTFWQVLRLQFQSLLTKQHPVPDDIYEDTRSALGFALEMKQRHGDPVVVKALIEHGARDFNTLNDDDLPVLVWAAAEGYTDIVQALLDRGADVNAYDHENDNWGALHYARQFHHPDIVQILLKAGAKR